MPLFRGVIRMNDFYNEYARLCADSARAEAFRKTGEDGTRIFNILNSNIKALKTVGEYIDTMYSLTAYSAAHKQKIQRVKEFNFRSLDNHSDVRAITRSDIVMLAGKNFGGYDSAFVTLLLYILLLDVGNGKSVTVIRTSKFLNDLPNFLKRNLYTYAMQIANSDPLLNGNIYQEVVVYYGDLKVYKEFLAYISDLYPDEAAISALFRRETADVNSPISKRLHNFQRSALKKDALYAVIFYSLDQYVRRCRMRGFRTGRKVCDAGEFLSGFFDYFDKMFEGALFWLGKIAAGDGIDTLKDFIQTDLNQCQREELYRCIMSAFDLGIPAS